MGMFRKIGGSVALWLKVFGWNVVFCKWVGNCFAPALVVEWHGVKKGYWTHTSARKAIANIDARLEKVAKGFSPDTIARQKASSIAYNESVLAERNRYIMPAWATITIRTKNMLETSIYFRGWRGFDFNSEHIAERLGEGYDAPHGYCYSYKGWLGNHHSV